MTARKALYICGSINQTTQMHEISKALPDFDAYFTPYYGTGWEGALIEMRVAEMSIGGTKLVRRCLDYLEAHGLAVDYKGEAHDYDLVITCSDQLMPANILDKPVVLVQEGMVDPPTLFFYLWKMWKAVPRWLAGTACNGQSGLYDRFCVASEGFRDYFAKHGADPGRMVITGIPNFDDCAAYHDNDFPHRGFVLVCTSDMRETFKYDNRKKFIKKAVAIAAGRQLIFKLHPNEKQRSVEEIERYAPGALIYRDGKAEEMVANADVVMCQFSSLALVALALGKEVHSYFDLRDLKNLQPVQNGCAAQKIADVCRDLVAEVEAEEARHEHLGDRPSSLGIQPAPQQDPLAAPRPAAALADARAGLDRRRAV